jgi:hypothetical protein
MKDKYQKCFNINKNNDIVIDDLEEDRENNNFPIYDYDT